MFFSFFLCPGRQIFGVFFTLFLEKEVSDYIAYGPIIRVFTATGCKGGVLKYSGGELSKFTLDTYGWLQRVLHYRLFLHKILCETELTSPVCPRALPHTDLSYAMSPAPEAAASPSGETPFPWLVRSNRTHTVVTRQ